MGTWLVEGIGSEADARISQMVGGNLRPDSSERNRHGHQLHPETDYCHRLLMDRDDPEKRIADLERQLAEPRLAGDPGANQGYKMNARRPALTTGGWLTPDQVHNVAFAKPPVGKRGYNEDEVDAFLDRVEAALQGPTERTLTPEQVRNVAFSKPPIGKRGYNEDEVDAFLHLVEEQMKSQQGASPLPPQAGFPTPPTDWPGQASPPDFGARAGIEPPPRPARSRRRQQLAGVWSWLCVIGVVGASLYLLGTGAHDFYEKSVGTPTRATVVRCIHHGRNINTSCTVTWSVGGESHTGQLDRELGSHRAGTSLDVRVRGDKAYTATSGIFNLGLGTLIAAVLVLYVVSFLVGRRWEGRHGSHEIRAAHRAQLPDGT
jgi:DivIVA domain-containing protein